MKSVAIIPARGGSKRIPRKNLRSFCGSPIVKYSIDAAIASGCFDEVMVSTEDAEIADIAKLYGCAVPFTRNAENSTDHATLIDVLKEVLSEYERSGNSFQYYCCILATAPFITPERIQQGKKLLLESNADSVIAVTQFGYPIQRAFKVDDQGFLKMIWPENLRVRSQDLPPSFQDAGLFYWGVSEPILRGQAVLTDRTVPLVIDEMEAQDIDNEADWRAAEIKFKVMRELERI